MTTASGSSATSGCGTLGRPFGAATYLRLKASARALVKKAGGQESAASITRAGHQTLSRYGLPDDATFMPVDVVADLEADIDAPVITRVLADLAGYLLIAKPPVVDADPEWISRLAALAKESGEAISKLAEALSAGGTITADEIRDLSLRQELREAAEVLATIDLALARIESGGEGA